MVTHHVWPARKSRAQVLPHSASRSGRPNFGRRQGTLFAVILATFAPLAVPPLDVSHAADQKPSQTAALKDAPGPGALEPQLATRKTPFENSLGMRFVPVPITGGPTDGKRVLVSIWDTRVQDYAAYARENQSVNAKWKDVEQEGEKQGPTHPVVNVTWDDAIEFCAWLTMKERAAGRIGPREVYRLPSDHEWSCAVGIGNREEATHSPQSKREKIKDGYPWGSDWPPPVGSGNYEPNLKVDDSKFTSPVGSFSANTHGLFDLGGNVWQWCEDELEPVLGRNYHVLRGGSCLQGERQILLSSFRSGGSDDSSSHDFGFRCVLADEPNPAEQKPPELAVTLKAIPGASTAQPSRASAYSVEYQKGAKSEPWRQAGDWVLGTRVKQRIVSIKFRSEDGGETLKGKIAYAGGGPLDFKADSAGGTQYKVMTQWISSKKELVDAGMWNIGGRLGARVVTLDLDSKDAGETLNGSITYDGNGSFRIRAKRKAVIGGNEQTASTPAREKAREEKYALSRLSLNDGVRVSIVRIDRGSSAIDNAPDFDLTIGVRLDEIVPELANVKGIRIVLDEVKDNDGNVLKKTKFFADRDRKFSTLERTFEPDKDGAYAQVDFWLEPGAAKAIAHLSGYVELLIPSRDPDSIVSASYAKAQDAGYSPDDSAFKKKMWYHNGWYWDYATGKFAFPLQNAALEAAGVQITLPKLKDPQRGDQLPGVVYQGSVEGDEGRRLDFWISDPNHHVAIEATEFFDAEGGKLGCEGFGSVTGFKFGDAYSPVLQVKPPANTEAKFYLLTEKSLVSVPFEFKDIPVPEK